MKYYIHPSHEGYGDQEKLPHAHICFGEKDDKSSQVSVSLITCKAIITGKSLEYRHQKEAENYVKNNLNKLKNEWAEKEGNHW